MECYRDAASAAGVCYPIWIQKRQQLVSAAVQPPTCGIHKRPHRSSRTINLFDISASISPWPPDSSSYLATAASSMLLTPERAQSVHTPSDSTMPNNYRSFSRAERFMTPRDLPVTLMSALRGAVIVHKLVVYGISPNWGDRSHISDQRECAASRHPPHLPSSPLRHTSSNQHDEKWQGSCCVLSRPLWGRSCPELASQLSWKAIRSPGTQLAELYVYRSLSVLGCILHLPFTADYRVTDRLPGVNFPLPTSYAGNVPVDRGPNNTLFFWGFEKRPGSLTAPASPLNKDPWGIWLNGG